jgi:hypothetical protein
MVARDAVRRAQHKPLVITVAEQQAIKTSGDATITAARLQDASVNPKMIANVRAAPVDPIMTTSRHHRSQQSELENRIPNPTSGHLERVCNSRRRREVERTDVQPDAQCAREPCKSIGFSLVLCTSADFMFFSILEF